MVYKDSEILVLVVVGVRRIADLTVGINILQISQPINHITNLDTFKLKMTSHR